VGPRALHMERRWCARAVVLPIDSEFASKAEARAEAEKCHASQALARRRREALARVNADAPVFMSGEMRTMVERALGLGALSSSPSTHLAASSRFGGGSGGGDAGDGDGGGGDGGGGGGHNSGGPEAQLEDLLAAAAAAASRRAAVYAGEGPFGFSRGDLQAARQAVDEAASRDGGLMDTAAAVPALAEAPASSSSSSSASASVSATSAVCSGVADSATGLALPPPRHHCCRRSAGHRRRLGSCDKGGRGRGDEYGGCGRGGCGRGGESGDGHYNGSWSF